MKCRITGALLTVLVAVVAGRAGPESGQFSKKYHLRPTGEENAEVELQSRFIGGQRACVIVRGDHDPIVGMEIAVYNADGQVVAKDESLTDFLAVMWVPPRTAEYRVVLRNRGQRDEYGKFEEPKKYTEVYLSIR